MGLGCPHTHISLRSLSSLYTYSPVPDLLTLPTRFGRAGGGGATGGGRVQGGNRFLGAPPVPGPVVTFFPHKALVMLGCHSFLESLRSPMVSSGFLFFG